MSISMMGMGMGLAAALNFRLYYPCDAPSIFSVFERSITPNQSYESVLHNNQQKALK